MPDTITLSRKIWKIFSSKTVTLTTDPKQFTYCGQSHDYRRVIGLHTLSTTVHTPYVKGRDMQIDLRFEDDEVIRYNDQCIDFERVKLAVDLFTERTLKRRLEFYQERLRVDGAIPITSKDPKNVPDLAVISSVGELIVGGHTSYNLRELDKVGGLSLGVSQSGFRSSSVRPHSLGLSPSGSRRVEREIPIHWDFSIVTAYIRKFVDQPV